MNTEERDRTAVRRQMKALRRSAFISSDKAALSAALIGNFLSLPEAKRGQTFFVYRSFGTEAPTDGLIEALLAAGKTVLLPVLKGSDMVPVLYQKGVPMSVNRWGIEEPLGEPFLREIDVAVVPLLAVDGEGNRLGYGGGYYDRFLARRKLCKVGFCYDCQIADKVVAMPHDVRLDRIVTEKRTVVTKYTGEKI